MKTAYLLTALFVLAGCGRHAAPPGDASPRPASRAPQKVEAAKLRNAYRIHDKVMSGGEPEGEEAFEELAGLGVKTIISVDGKKPNVVSARKHGLRYVHLPHGYDGISDERVLELAKAVRDLEGPIYIHCHHGKHRSPAAAAVACVSARLIDRADALAVLRTAGTSESYRGLYQSVADAKPLDKEQLDTLRMEFREAAEIPALAEAMVSLEHTFDRLKLISAAGWRPPKSHPDLDPPHEALLLREHFAELLRTREVLQHPKRFQELLRDSETAAGALETALRNGKPPDGQSTEPNAAAALDRIAKNCAACHKEFRDVPLREKTSP